MAEAWQAGEFYDDVIQRVREEHWSVKRTRRYVNALKESVATLTPADAPPSACPICGRHAVPHPLLDGRRAQRQYCSDACRQRAYRKRKGGEQ